MKSAIECEKYNKYKLFTLQLRITILFQSDFFVSIQRNDIKTELWFSLFQSLCKIFRHIVTIFPEIFKLEF